MFESICEYYGKILLICYGPQYICFAPFLLALLRVKFLNESFESGINFIQSRNGTVAIGLALQATALGDHVPNTHSLTRKLVC